MQYVVYIIVDIIVYTIYFTIYSYFILLLIKHIKLINILYTDFQLTKHQSN